MENVLLQSERMLFSEKEEQFKTRNAAQLSKSINEFTNDLFTSIANDDDENFVNSGLSAHLVLSMCSLGARKKTQQEIYNVLHLGKSISLDNFKKFILNLDDSRKVTLGIVNRMYVDKQVVVKHQFRRDVQNFFDSDMVATDFLNVDDAVKTVNEQCSEQTCGKIKEIIKNENICTTTRMILTNAVYFQADWLNKFPSLWTTDEHFFVDKRTIINIPMMRNNKPLFYKNLANVNAECIGIPYQDQDFVFVVIKPKKLDGLDYVEENLCDIQLNYHDDFKNCENIRHVNLSLPKFKIESSLHLGNHVQNLGIIDAFKSESTNFKGISDRPKLVPPLHIDEIFQKASIEVNEKGSGAAAPFTPSEQAGSEGAKKPVEWIDFKVDRPFLFRIVNVSNNVILISGRVTKPQYF